MKTAKLSLPELALIAGTRAMGGAGAALLLSEKLPRNMRRPLGWGLFLVGALSTLPLVLRVAHKMHRA